MIYLPLGERMITNKNRFFNHSTLPPIGGVILFVCWASWDGDWPYLRLLLLDVCMLCELFVLYLCASFIKECYRENKQRRRQNGDPQS